MFESIMNFFKKLGKSEIKETKSKETAKERLHLVLMQDRANVSADFLEMMKQEIIEVIKKYIEVDEKEIDVRLTNEIKEDGTTGAPSLYANIPIMNIKNEMKKEIEKTPKEEKNEEQKEEAKEVNKEQSNTEKEEKTKDQEKNKEEEPTEVQEDKKQESKKDKITENENKDNEVKKEEKEIADKKNNKNNKSGQ